MLPRLDDTLLGYKVGTFLRWATGQIFTSVPTIGHKTREIKFELILQWQRLIAKTLKNIYEVSSRRRFSRPVFTYGVLQSRTESFSPSGVHPHDIYPTLLVKYWRMECDKSKRGVVTLEMEGETRAAVRVAEP